MYSKEIVKKKRKKPFTTLFVVVNLVICLFEYPEIKQITKTVSIKINRIQKIYR